MTDRTRTRALMAASICPSIMESTVELGYPPAKTIALTVQCAKELLAEVERREAQQATGEPPK